MKNNLTITSPDDWHIHFRDGELLGPVAAATAHHFSRGIIMPNLVPPVVTAKDARTYRDRILSSLGAEYSPDKPSASGFTPLMTLYLTEGSDAADIEEAATSGLITAVKLYPAGATTNSASGVTDISKVMPVLEKMAQIGLVLCVHGEVTDPAIDIFDREATFIDRVLAPLQKELPELKIVFEHITTADGADYVASGNGNIAATITPHHLMINRNHMLVGGIRPHYYCLPIVKRERHQQALRKAATGNSQRFFLGTDSAPHTTDTKESACGCAGVFNSPNTLSCVAHVFEEENALEKLESFVSLNGAAFYGLPTNQTTISLIKQSEPVHYPAVLQTPAGDITVFDPGVELFWAVDA